LAPATKFEISTNERLARIEERLRPRDRTVVGAVITAILAAAIGGVAWWGWYVTTNIVAIKQQLVEGGNKALVSSLENPKSSASLRADLSTVIATVQTAEAKGALPNRTKTLPLSQAIAKVITQPSSPPEAWQAASQIINYRSYSATPDDLPPCKLSMVDLSDQQDMRFLESWRIDQSLTNCTFVIDDPENAETLYRLSQPARDRYHIPRERVYVNYVLTNVHIIYSGRPILAATIQMRNCNFEFQVLTEPSASGRHLLEKLLLADDLNNVDITSSDNGKSIQI